VARRPALLEGDPGEAGVLKRQGLEGLMFRATTMEPGGTKRAAARESRRARCAETRPNASSISTARSAR
jgi:hypothetical protein